MATPARAQGGARSGTPKMASSTPASSQVSLLPTRGGHKRPLSASVVNSAVVKKKPQPKRTLAAITAGRLAGPSQGVITRDMRVYVSNTTPLSMRTAHDRASSRLASRPAPLSAKKTNGEAVPQWSTREICEKLCALQKKMDENEEVAKEKTEKLAAENQTLSKETERLREELKDRVEEVSDLKREKSILASKVEEFERELNVLRTRLQSKSTELEALDKTYHMLDCQYRAVKQVADTREAEILRLNVLLDNSRNDAKRLGIELEKAVDQKEAAKARMRDNDARLRLINNQMLELKGNIRVFARVRPIASDEGEPVVQVGPDETLTLTKSGLRGQPGSKLVAVPFQFDRVLPATVGQAEVFEEVERLVVSALDGYNVCILAYGQTGSGKTYTMEGPPGIDFEAERQQHQQFGIVPRSLHRIFELTEERLEGGWVYTLDASFVEIYNETIQDLLANNRKECHIRQTADAARGEGVFVENAVTVTVTSVRQIAQLMEKSRRNRSVAATRCNQRSSRSHCVFQLRIAAVNTINGVRRESVLNLVDLAGSERVKESGAEGVRFTETKHINSSLTQLSTVLMSLRNKAVHIPYRNSKLTHLLSTSLSGNSKILMFANVSPASAHVNETLNSLKFAQKVNEVHIGPVSRNTR